MGKSNSLYQRHQKVIFNSGKEVTIVKRVDSVLVRKAQQVMEISIYKVLYDDRECYASDIGLNSASDAIFKEAIAGIGYRGSINIYDYKKEYDLWKNIIYRCYWPNNSLYKYYGEKGVTVDPKWLCFECFIYDMINFANYNKFRTSNKIYDFDLEYKQGHLDKSKRVYGPGLVSLRQMFCTDVSRALDEMKMAGTGQTVVDGNIPTRGGKKKLTVDDFKPDKDGNWPDEAYQAVIDNPPKLLVPDGDNNLPIGAVRVLNGVIYTNRPLLTSVVNPDGYFGAKRAMRFEDYFNNNESFDKNDSPNRNKVMCVVVDNKSTRNK